MSTVTVEIVPEDRSGAGKASRHIRLKDYAKQPEDLNVYAPVPEVACVYASGCPTLKDANKVAMVDLAGCNLNCWWCYQRGRSAETEEVHSEDLAAELAAEASPAWRISGGEPTLQDGLEDLLDDVTWHSSGEHIIWINTNGYRPNLIRDDVGTLFVEYSIKGFTPELAQWNARATQAPHADTIRELYRMGHQLFLNVCPLAPQGMDEDDTRHAVESFGEGLQEIHPALPLLVTVIKPKRYPWIPDWIEEHDDLSDIWEAWLEWEYDWLDRATPQWMWARAIASDMA